MTKYIHAAALASEIGCSIAEVMQAIRLGVCGALRINGGYLVPEHDAGKIRAWVREAKTPDATASSGLAQNSPNA
jgi:hypothetical protein